ncbi:MAG: hypothetical protein AAB632_01610 [Patescibacteria group bacterium]
MGNEKPAISQEYEEAHQINNVLNEVKKTREAFDTDSIKPLEEESGNTTIVDKNIEMLSKIKNIEMRKPRFKKDIDTVERKMRDFIPEYTNDINIRNFINICSEEDFVKGAWGLENPLDHPAYVNPEEMIIYVQERFLNQKFATFVISHELVHLISYGQGKTHKSDGDFAKYKTRSGIRDDEVDYTKNVYDIENIKETKTKEGRLNEYLTDYFTIEMLGGLGSEELNNIIGKSEYRTELAKEHEIISLIKDITGEKVLRRAYFEGEKESFVGFLGEDNFNNLSNLLDNGEEDRAKELLLGIVKNKKNPSS